MIDLSSYALINEAEAERYIDEGLLTAKLELVRTAINQSSAIVEDYLCRVLVTRGTITEYHWLRSGYSEIYLRYWPVISLTSAHEDSGREYGDSEKLTENTDFIVVSEEGKLIRTASATLGTTAWLTGFEAIKVLYTAGYATTAVVPSAIKDVCMRHVAEIYHEVTRKEANYESVSGDMGTFRRIGPAMLTSGMKRDLDPYRERSFGGKTWTRCSVA